MTADAQAVLAFWFQELTPAQWFKKDDNMDRQIAERFSDVLARAAACECFEWRRTAQGRLAEIIVLDQFSRNIHRDSAQAFANGAEDNPQQADPDEMIAGFPAHCVTPLSP